MTELGERTELTPLTPFEQDIFSDYKLSFVHSQGNPEAQRKMFVYFGMNYPVDPNFDIDSMRSHIQERVDKLTLPSRHTQTEKYANYKTGDKRPIGPQEASDEFNRCWEIYSDVLEFRMSGQKILPNRTIELIKSYKNNPEEFPIIIATEMLNKDLSFQKYGRPNAVTEEKKWESFVKKHAINRISTGNERIDHLYQQTLPFLEEAKTYTPPTSFDDLSTKEDMLLSLHDLAEAWNENHPGSSFFEAD